MAEAAYTSRDRAFVLSFYESGTGDRRTKLVASTLSLQPGKMSIRPRMTRRYIYVARFLRPIIRTGKIITLAMASSAGFLMNWQKRQASRKLLILMLSGTAGIPSWSSTKYIWSIPVVRITVIEF